MLKHSHFVTPRSMSECHFTPGYRCAEPRYHWTDAGHWLLTAFSLALIVVGVPLVIFGVV